MAATHTHPLPMPGRVTVTFRCGCAHVVGGDPIPFDLWVATCDTHTQPWHRMGYVPEVPAAPVQEDWEARLLASLR